MAGCKVIWILFVSALVGCVLINADKNNQEASEKLIFKLKNKTPQEQEEILGNCSNLRVKIYDRLVGEWAGLCKESPQRCSPDEFDRVKRMSTPELSSYTEHCEAKLKQFCSEHFDEVVEHFVGNEESKKLMASFVQYYKEAAADKVRHNKANPSFRKDKINYDIIEAFLKLLESEYEGKKIAVAGRIEFMKKLMRIAKIYPRLQQLKVLLVEGHKSPKIDSWYDDAANIANYFLSMDDEISNYLFKSVKCWMLGC